VAAVLACCAVVGVATGMAPAPVPDAPRADAPAQAKTPDPAEERKPRTDLYGDPLPEGAMMRLGTLRFCQPLPVSLAFSPDAKALASGGYDNRIRLWDPDTGKELRTLEGHKSYVNCIALSADGKWLVSGSQDHDLRLWEVDTGKAKRRFRGHEAPIERLALSPNGKVLASSCLAGTLRLWDTDTGKEIRSLPIDKGYRVLAMTFTPDSKHFAFNNRWDKGIQLVDVAEGKVIRTFEGHKNEVHELIFTADGATLISGAADHTIRVWDVASGKEQRRYGDEKQLVRCLALAPDGKTLTYGTHPDGLVHIWDLATNKDLVPPWKAHPWCVVSIAYSPDSKKVALGRDTIAIHETATGKRLNPPTESQSPVHQIEYAADGRSLAVWRRDETIELWETAKWRKTATIKPKIGRFASMAFSPSGKYLTTAEGDFNQGFLCHWDPQTGKRQQEFPQGKGWIEALSYSADGETLTCVHTSQHGIFLLWDPATGKERVRIPATDTSAKNARISPDGKLLACFTSRNTVALWDTKTQTLVRDFGKMLPGGWGLLVFSPDGRTIATPGGQGVDDRIPIQPDIVLWETATGQERLHIAHNEGQVRQIAFSPDGRLLASAGRSETIRLWDTWTGKEVGRFTGHRGWVISLAFAPDGKTLASGGVDATVLLWDVSTYRSDKRRLVEKRTPEQLALFVRELEGEDAAAAYRAIIGLANHPDEAVSLLKKRLGSTAVQEARVARLIEELDADEFAVRERASAELARLGKAAEDALRKAATNTTSPEVRRRAQELLANLKGDSVSPEQRVAVRAVEVLEHIATPEARQLLQNLARGAPDTRLTREARAALARLAKGDARP
jgi:WD40 repeat protein